jgi:bromodomain adjacent to zinc finger domain protein 1A
MILIYRSLREIAGSIVDKLYYHPLSYPFWETLKNLGELESDYFKTIKRPIDLNTIWNNVEDSKYGSFGEFCKEVSLVFSNCREFNQKNSELYETSLQIEDYFRILIEPFKKLNLSANV